MDKVKAVKELVRDSFKDIDFMFDDLTSEEQDIIDNPHTMHRLSQWAKNAGANAFPSGGVVEPALKGWLRYFLPLPVEFVAAQEMFDALTQGERDIVGNENTMKEILQWIEPQNNEKFYPDTK